MGIREGTAGQMFASAGRIRERVALPAPHVSLLAGVPLFAGLSKRHLKRIARTAEEVHHRAGAVVFLQDAGAAHLYVVAEGTARAFRGFVPSSRTIRRFGPGDFFGDIAVLNGGTRTASVAAETQLTCIRISRTNLDKLLRAEPDIALRVLHGLAARMGELVEEVVH